MATDPMDPTPAVGSVPEPVFRSDGAVLVPSEGAAGPWFPGVQHGGAVMAITARAVELVPTPQPMQLARLTLDLSRRVPMAPITVDTEIQRDGFRLQSLAVTIRHDDEVVARATALRMRVADGAVPPEHMPAPWPEDAPPPHPEEGVTWEVTTGNPDFLGCFDARRIGEISGGRGTTWLRFLPPLVDDEPLTPTVRLAAAADLILSAASLIGPGYVTANADLTLNVERLPAGPWVGIESVARVDARGIGLSEGVLFDLDGRLGRAAKSVLVDRRPEPG